MSFRLGLLLAGFSLCISQAASATEIVESSSVQHYADGTKVSSGAFLTAHQNDSSSVNDAAPFDGHFIGGDPAGPNFSASWSYTYGAVAPGTISSATLTFGILDADSAAPGDQLTTFTVNGVSEFTALNALLEAAPGPNVSNGENSIDNVYTVTLDSAALAMLYSGSATFDLALQGPGLGVLGQTDFNGAALDFATFTINTAAAITLPEPRYYAPLALLLAGSLFFFRRRPVR